MGKQDLVKIAPIWGDFKVFSESVASDIDCHFLMHSTESPEDRIGSALARVINLPEYYVLPVDIQYLTSRYGPYCEWRDFWVYLALEADEIYPAFYAIPKATGIEVGWVNSATEQIILGTVFHGNSPVPDEPDPGVRSLRLAVGPNALHIGWKGEIYSFTKQFFEAKLPSCVWPPQLYVYCEDSFHEVCLWTPGPKS